MPEKSVSTGGGVVRACRNDEFSRIHFIINDAAVAYRGVIPDDRWHVPYMSEDQLEAEFAAGVRFLGWYLPTDTLHGVMGAQDVQDVALIRHAYVLSASQRGGIGSALIAGLMEATERPLLVGTWKAAELGRRLLRATRVPDRRRHGNAAAPLLEHPRSSDRNLRGSGRPAMVRGVGTGGCGLRRVAGETRVALQCPRRTACGPAAGVFASRQDRGAGVVLRLRPI